MKIPAWQLSLYAPRRPRNKGGTITPKSRDAVTRREGEFCTYCGAVEGPFELDHIFPRSRGGSNEPSNLTLACGPCNRSKGGRTLREWMASRD